MTDSYAYPGPSYEQNELTEIIKQAAYNELMTCTLYFTLTMNKTIQATPELSSLVNSAYEEDWEHYLSLIQHLYSLKKTIKLQADNKIFPSHQHLIWAEKTETQHLLKTLKKAENTSILYQQKICSMTLEHDYKTFDLSYSLMNENIFHKDSISNLLTQSMIS